MIGPISEETVKDYRERFERMTALVVNLANERGRGAPVIVVVEHFRNLARDIRALVVSIEDPVVMGALEGLAADPSFLVALMTDTDFQFFSKLGEEFVAGLESGLQAGADASAAFDESGAAYPDIPEEPRGFNGGRDEPPPTPAVVKVSERRVVVATHDVTVPDGLQPKSAECSCGWRGQPRRGRLQREADGMSHAAECATT